MRLFLLTLFLAFFLATASAVKEPQKSFLVTYPAEAPQSEVDRAIEALKSAGGVILHEYKLLRGFAAKASESSLNEIKTLSDKYVPYIEEDGIVSIDGKLSNTGK